MGRAAFFGETDGILGWFTPAEGQWYAQAAERVTAGRILEVGVYDGLSLSYIRHTIHTQKNTIIGVDIVLRPALVARAAEWGVQLQQANSVVASQTYPPGHFDLVFIDADHEYPAVKQDIECWLPLVRPGGTLAGHDFAARHPGVMQAVRERFTKFENPVDSIWAVTVE